MFLKTQEGKIRRSAQAMANDQDGLLFCERKSVKREEDTMSKVPWDHSDELPEVPGYGDSTFFSKRYRKH